MMKYLEDKSNHSEVPEVYSFLLGWIFYSHLGLLIVIIKNQTILTFMIFSCLNI